jgi:phage shock protein C
MTKTPKQLFRSEQNKVWTGIIGGVGEYFSIDPTILRVAWVLITIFSGVLPGLIVYIISAFIIPKPA